MTKPALPVFAADKGSSSTPRNGPISLRRGAARRSPGSGSSPAAPSRPLPKGPVAMAAGSPLTVAGAAPVLHRTSLWRRDTQVGMRRQAPLSPLLAGAPAGERRRRTVAGIAMPAEPHLGRAVDRDDAPAMPHARPVDVVYAGDRAVFHRKGEAGFRLEVEREAERRADRATMRDGDDVAPAMRVKHPVDGARNALHHIDKALAARRALMRRRMPEP